MPHDALLPLEPTAIERAAKLIAEADALVIAAGAGIGVDSGLPDFRGNAGFWKAYPALANDGVGFMEAASPRSFQQDPRRAWGFYGHRLALYRATEPHPGFAMLRAWGEAKRDGYFVFTSNVDGQFQQAGFDPLRIEECHGSIHHVQCCKPCSPTIWGADTLAPEVDQGACRLLNEVPTCSRCGGTARPNILMFNDWHWIASRRERQVARRQRWLERARSPVVIEIGAGSQVATVRAFSHRMVLQNDGALIRINPRESEVGTLRGVGIASGALVALQAIEAMLAS